MEEKVEAIEEKLNQIVLKLDELLSVPKSDEAAKQETIKLQIELEKVKFDHEQKRRHFERMMRDEEWEREDRMHLKKRSHEVSDRREEREHELEMQKLKNQSQYFKH